MDFITFEDLGGDPAYIRISEIAVVWCEYRGVGKPEIRIPYASIFMKGDGDHRIRVKETYQEVISKIAAYYYVNRAV